MSRAHADVFGSGDNSFEIEFVTIGNPGNPPDTFGYLKSSGSVDYLYRIGKYEISREMIEKSNVEGGLGISMHPMNGIVGKFGVGPRRAVPATSVSWNAAARFANWLNTSQGFSPAYKFSTQPGEAGFDANASTELWQTQDAGYGPNNLFRNSQSRCYFVPSIDEWYKADIYEPHANGGAGGYWAFRTPTTASQQHVLITRRHVGLILTMHR